MPPTSLSASEPAPKDQIRADDRRLETNERGFAHLPCLPVPLRERILVPERMDAPNLPKAEHDWALRGLARLNRISRADLMLWRFLAPRLASLPSGGVLRILDVATGSGDVPIRLSQRARHRFPNAKIQWAVCDASDHALETATRRAHAINLQLQAHRLDVTTDPLPEHDVTICGLFLHHLESLQVVELLGRMAAAATTGIIISDLQRTRTGLFLANVAGRCFSRSPIVHSDAPASVRAAFTHQELADIASRAGLETSRITRVFPERMILDWSADGVAG
jgi:2-polyprenyl-3-methyl-5-hydroxy-6-metoxy-1,4-benzoquinol methylase